MKLAEVKERRSLSLCERLNERRSFIHRGTRMGAGTSKLEELEWEREVFKITIFGWQNL